MSANSKSFAIYRRRLQVAAISLAAAAAFTLTAAGCGSDSGGSAGSVPVPLATGHAASAQVTALGMILVDGKGRTIYEFANDKDSRSTCEAVCAATWPYVPAPASLPTSLPGVAGKIGTTTRDDGTRQLTVAGHPVYTFVGDSTPGQTNGQGLNLNGGVWNVVSPVGAPVTNSSPAGASTQIPAAPGY